MSETLPLERWMANVRDAVERIAEGFTDPDDDFVPVVMFEMPDGRRELFNVPDGFLAPEIRHSSFALIGVVLRRLAVKRVCLVLSTWQVALPPGQDADAFRAGIQGSLADVPGRMEAVMVSAADATEQQVWASQIERHEGRPPTLGAWSETPHAEGPVMDAMLFAVRGELE